MFNEYVPTEFSVAVNTPEPVTVKIDVSEKTMVLVGFVALVSAAVVIKKVKR